MLITIHGMVFGRDNTRIKFLVSITSILRILVILSLRYAVTGDRGES